MPTLDVRILDDPPYTIDDSILKRFDSRKDAFARRPGDHAASRFDCAALYQHTDDAFDPIARCRSEQALARSAKELEQHLIRHFCGIDPQSAELSRDTGLTRRRGSSDPGVNSESVKYAARKIGADLVGICKVRDQWIYSCDREGSPIELPPGCENAIVMGVRMDPRDVMDATGSTAHMASMIGYMRMGVCAAAMGRFIRNTGYTPVPACNGIGLSIPLAIDAGLGELGRNGLLITPQFGPCVRICKVFTDMPLVPDRPIEFGVTNFCAQCLRCCDACEVQAISSVDEPSFDTTCVCNNPGVVRWAVHSEKCLQFWSDNGGNCSACIATCPFTMKGWLEAGELP